MTFLWREVGEGEGGQELRKWEELTKQQDTWISS